MVEPGQFLKKFFFGAFAGLFAAALLVVVMDPFYHYHAPIPPLKKVLKDKEYQCIGSLRNFAYDGVLAGSSMAENFNDRWFEKQGLTMIKAIRASGTTADLNYYLEEAFASRQRNGQKLKAVYYNVDTAALFADKETTFAATGQPMYLYNANPFDDVEYLWNKDVIFEKIPVEVAESLMGDYDEGSSYNWAQWKTFSKEQMLKAWMPPETVKEDRGEEADGELLEENIRILKNLVSAHPDTEFVFYFPPYSILWWGEACYEGNVERNLHGKERVQEELLAFPNVRMYDLQWDESCILNLDNYMDTLHFSDIVTREVFDTITGDRPCDPQGTPYALRPDRDGDDGDGDPSRQSEPAQSPKESKEKMRAVLERNLPRLEEITGQG